MRDWDKSEETKSKKDSIGVIMLVSAIFAFGFIMGILWGMSWETAVLEPIPPVFGEVQIQLSSIGVTDEVQILP